MNRINIFLLLLSSLCCSTLVAQTVTDTEKKTVTQTEEQTTGVNFQYDNLDKAMDACSQSGYIFVDLFAKWCGPCKMMDKQIFTLKEVGDYINPNFITCRLDADTNEGKAFMAKNSIDRLPTLLVLNKKGELLKTHSGLVDDYGLIRFLREARGEGIDMDKLYSAHTENPSDLATMQALLIEAPYFIKTITSETQLKKWSIRISDIFKLYTEKKGVENMGNRKDFQIITTYHNYYEKEDEVINKMIRYFHNFSQEIDEKRVAQFITGVHIPYIIALAQNCKTEYQQELSRLTSDMMHIYSITQNDAENFQSTLTDFCTAACAISQKDVPTYVEHMQNYLLALPEPVYNDYAVAIEGLYNGLNEKLDNLSAETIIGWAKTAFEMKPQVEAEAPLTMVLGDAYKQLGDKVKARAMYDQAFKLMMMSQKHSFIQNLQPQIAERIKALEI